MRLWEPVGKQIEVIYSAGGVLAEEAYFFTLPEVEHHQFGSAAGTVIHQDGDMLDAVWQRLTGKFGAAYEPEGIFVLAHGVEIAPGPGRADRVVGLFICFQIVCRIVYKGLTA